MSSLAGRARPICVIGNANLDLVAGSIDDWPAWGTEIYLAHSDFRIGGSAANSAMVLQRLGCDVGLISARGPDAAGAMIAAQFKGKHDRIAPRPERTSISAGILQTGGERSFFSTNGHLDGLDAAFFIEALADWSLEGAIALVSGASALPALVSGHGDLLRWLRDRGAEIAIDPGWPAESWSAEEKERFHAWLALTDHLLFNEMEVLGLSGADTIDAALEHLGGLVPDGARVIAKLGDQGAALWRGGVAIRAPARSLDVIDTVGAGDAFNAGYLAAMARGMNDEAALECGVHVASHVISEFPRGSDAIALVP